MRRFACPLIGLLLATQSVHSRPQTSRAPSNEAKVGQMLLVGFRGTEIDEDSAVVRMLGSVRPGGVILFDYDVPSQSFPRNILNPRQVGKLNADLQAFSEIPLFIAVDAEGGRVNRLKPVHGFSEIPSAQEMGKKNLDECRKVYEVLARQLSSAGFNFNLAPVVDLNLHPDNPVIGSLERSFSADVRAVVARASVFIAAHRKYGVITALKHFPGHGSSREDSHLGLVDVTRWHREEELTPYRILIKEHQAEAIMTAHVVNSRVDPDHPATLSPRFLQSLLREKLAFAGVIVSDDMQMGAIRDHYGFAEAVIKAVDAGCDLIAISNNGETYDETAVFRARDALLNAVRCRRLTQGRIDSAYSRIIRLKKKFGIIPDGRN